jgi:hypothetical protein
MVDISGYLSPHFVKVDELAGGPRRCVIGEVPIGKFGRPDLHFQDGACLGVNTTNLRTLYNAWGKETDDWIGREVELFVGKIKYQGQEQDAVLIRAISSAVPVSVDMNDEIPF